jgi:tRNA dimethylallyltransferase
MVRIGVDMPRDVLYDRINRRVDMMMEAGLEAEARAVWPHKHLNALQTVGYKELFDYFEGNCTLTEAVELIKRNSRRYAKRQLTWFRRHEQTHWLSPTDIDKAITIIENK